MSPRKYEIAENEKIKPKMTKILKNGEKNEEDKSAKYITDRKYSQQNSPRSKVVNLVEVTKTKLKSSDKKSKDWAVTIWEKQVKGEFLKPFEDLGPSFCENAPLLDRIQDFDQSELGIHQQQEPPTDKPPDWLLCGKDGLQPTKSFVESEGLGNNDNG